MLLFLHLWMLAQLSGLTQIARYNSALVQARAANARGNYTDASQKLAEMAAIDPTPSDKLLLNLGHAQFKAGNLAQAAQSYTRLAASPESDFRSVAHTQLGVIAMRGQNTAEAQNQFRQALRADPNNQIARLNYERALRRRPDLAKPPPPQNKADKDKDKDKQEEKETQKNQDQKNNQNQKDTPKPEPSTSEQNKLDKADPKNNQDNKEAEKNKANRPNNNNNNQNGQADKPQNQNSEGGTAPPKPSSDGQNKNQPNGTENNGSSPREDAKGTQADASQLAKMQLTPAQAKALLEAMRSSEVQYLQQRRNRRQNNTSGKPSW
jgi:hypothetical protein